MTDYFLPVDCDPAAANWRLVANTLVGRSPTVGTIRTAEKLGDAWAVNLKFPPFKDESATLRRRSRILAFAGRLRGHAGRVVLPVPGYTGPSWAPELLSNNTFASGTAGWTADNCVLTVVDRMARMTVTTPAANVQLRQSVALTQYAPHVLRGFIVDGPQTAGLNIGPSLTLGAAQSSQDYSTARGMKTVVGVAEDTTSRSQFPVVFSSVTGFAAGAYLSVPYTSLARCALVDNSPNAYQRSDTIGVGGYWSTGNLAGIADDNATAPDGTSTADTITENGGAGQHYLQRTETRASAAEDWCITAMVRRGSGTRNVELVIGRDLSTNFTRAIFDLGTGAVGSITNNGDNTNGRSFIVDMGGGWYGCYLVARLAASTSVGAHLGILNGTANSYTGDGTSSLQLWRLGAARSGVPLRLGQTTTAATTGTAQSGVGLYTKGWPVSTNDLLKEGAWIEIGGAHCQVVAPVNSDAAGLAFIQLNRPPRVAPADNAPIIVNNPLGRYLLEENQVAWEDTPGVFSELSLPFIEDVAA